MNKPGDRCSQGIPSPHYDSPSKGLAAACHTARQPGQPARAGWLGGGITAFYSLDSPAAYFGVFWEMSLGLRLWVFFPTLLVMDKNSLEKCKLQKGCGCLQGGRGFLPWGKMLFLCLQGAQEGARRKCWWGTDRPFLHWGLKTEKLLNYFAWKSHSSRGDYILTRTTTQRTWL